MGQVGRFLRRIGAADGYTNGGYAHFCPACHRMHAFAVDGPFRNGAQWTFNGNIDAPTFNPSMHIKVNTPDMGADYQPKAMSSVCHYFLRDGQIQFLGDCTHAMAGQTVPLPELPPDLRDRSS